MGLHRPATRCASGRSARTVRTRFTTARSGCSSNGHARAHQASRPMRASWSRSPEFVVVSTASRWQSSLRRHARRSLEWRVSQPGSTTASCFSRAAVARQCPATGPCKQRLTGSYDLLNEPERADAAGTLVRSRLLETTRAYAFEKLVQSGEFDIARRDAMPRAIWSFLEALRQAETRPTDEWLAVYGPRTDNVRAARDWAFSPSGDASLGVSLLSPLCRYGSSYRYWVSAGSGLNERWPA
jgi:hypothetical protein